MTYKRYTNFDVLRSLAAFMVVCIHSTIYYWKDYAPDSFGFFVFTLFNCIGRCAVPLFFMISGAFMLQHKIDIKYVLKKTGKLVLVYVIWSALYAFSELGGNIIHFQLSQWLDNFINEKFHLWFLPIMICIYVILPILYSFVHYEEGRYVGYAVVLFFIFGICKNTLIVLFPENDYLNTSLGKCSVELCEYTGYFLLGYYLLVLDKKKIRTYLAWIIYGVSVVFAIAVTQIVSMQQQKIVNVFNSYFSLPVFLEAVSLFIIFRELKIDWDRYSGIDRVVTYIARTSLGIYLLHPFVMEHLDSMLGINAKMCHVALALPVVVVLSFGISSVIIGIMKKIPVINKLC